MSFIVKESIRTMPLPNAAVPAIMFTFKAKTNDLELITDINGLLLSEDEKILSYLIKSDPLTSHAQEHTIGELGATKTHLDDAFTNSNDET